MTDRPGRVFICYRREETKHVAGRLADRLEDRLGSTQVFMDINTLQPGDDFVVAIQAAVSTCDACIVLIGPNWLTVTDRRGRRRLDDPHDFVVVEVTTALKHRIRVIPVLVDGAEMPRADELPDALRPLAQRHAVRIDHETFRSDVAPLIAALERLLAARAQAPALRAAGPPPRAAAPFEVDRESSRGKPRTVTADDVRTVVFRTPPIGKRGYNEDEVDAFLDLVENALRDPGATSLTAEDVRNVAFSKPPTGKRGYHEDEVDTFLDLVENTVRALRQPAAGPSPA